MDTGILRYFQTPLVGCALAAFCAVLPVGCVDNGHIPEPALPDDGESRVTVVLRVPLEGSGVTSRANPEAGEDGNGRERGILNENQVHDVNLFFYKGSGLNPSDAGVQVAGIFIPSMDADRVEEENLPFEKKITITLNAAETSLAGSGLLDASADVSFITVVNAGKDLYTADLTLSQLREFTGFGSTWTPKAGSSSVADCDFFVMTTAYDADCTGNIKLDGESTRNVGSGRLVRVASVAEGSSTPKRPEWRGETTVQRMCARIDVMYKEDILTGTGAAAELIYPLTDAGTSEDKVHLTNILPVNVMAKPSYLLTKVTDGIPASWTADGLGSFSWGGVEKSAGSPAVPANYVIEPQTLLKTATPGDALLTEWYGASRTFQVMKDIKDNNDLGKIGGYYSGTLPADGGSYGCTEMTVIGYANENVQAPEVSKSAFVTGLVFRALYQPKKWTAKSEGSWTETEMSDETWKALANKGFTRYSPTVKADGSVAAVRADNARYFSSHQDAVDYAAAHPEEEAIVTRFDNGICYYNLWLRHYNDADDANPSDPHASLPMEYAIVRNNIYRVALTFSGPGDPEPVMREPETMKARIFVRKWNMRKEKNPLQF